MIAAGSRLRQIGWVVILAICLAGCVALTFRVNAVKSEVRLAERRIIQLEREKLLLETEVETRANQQQLASWNALEFGYEAPRADPWAVTDAPAPFVAAQLKGIVGIALRIETLIGKRKLSQNRGEADREGVVAGLSASEDAADRAVAEAMRAG